MQPQGLSSFPARHERHYHIAARRGQPRPPSHCTGAGRSVYLGYQFNTDVLLLRTTLSAPFLHDLSDSLAFGALRDALNSLSNGLALTAAGELDIDTRELQCGIRLQRVASGESIADLYLYDTLAGGAGYSSLIGRNFAAISRQRVPGSHVARAKHPVVTVCGRIQIECTTIRSTGVWRFN